MPGLRLIALQALWISHYFIIRISAWLAPERFTAPAVARPILIFSLCPIGQFRIEPLRAFARRSPHRTREPAMRTMNPTKTEAFGTEIQTLLPDLTRFARV